MNLEDITPILFKIEQLWAVATIKLPTLFLMKRWLKIKFAKDSPQITECPDIYLYSPIQICICLGLIRKELTGFHNVLKESSSWIFIKAYLPRYLFCIFLLDCWFKKKRFQVCFDFIYETLFYRPNYFGNYSYNTKYGNVLQKTRQPSQ